MFMTTRGNIFLFLSISICAHLIAQNESHTSIPAHKDRCGNIDIDSRDLLDCDDCCSQLTLAKLCVRAVKARCIDVLRIKGQDISANQMNAKTICANDVQVNRSLCVANLNVPTLCTEQLTTENACIKGVLTVNQLEQCGKFRATMAFTNDTLYNLGDLINFDAIIDDPNSNVSLAPFASYTAPKSGYYAFVLYIEEYDFMPTIPRPILGTPVSLISLLVNGIPCHRIFSPFLAFHSRQDSFCSGLLLLKAGDVITMKYNIFASSDAGLVDTPGTVILEGNGTPNHTTFKIHLLSVDCSSDDICQPCQPCQVACSVNDTPCQEPCADCPCPPTCVLSTPTNSKISRLAIT